MRLNFLQQAINNDMRLIEIDPNTKAPTTQYNFPEKPTAPRAPKPKSAATLPTIKPIKPMTPSEALIASLKKQIQRINQRIQMIRVMQNKRRSS
jgi:hypothetical protein